MAKKAPAKSLKKEIVEVYDQVLFEDDIESSKSLDKKQVELVEKAKSQSTSDVIHEIAALKLKFSATLDELAKNLVLEKEKLAAVQQSIGLENEKLKELYEIQASAGSLEALLAAQRLKSEEFEKEMAQKKEVFGEEMRAQKLEWEREQKEYDRETKEKEDQRKKLWARLEEEYEYKYKLRQQQDDDQYNLKKSALEQELAVRKAQSEKDLTEREAILMAHEQELASLREEKAAAAQSLQQKIEEVSASVTKDLEQRYKFNMELYVKEADGQLSLLKQKVELLEDKLRERQKLVDDMTRQLQAAHVQCQELAKQVIEGASRVKGFALHDTPEKERRTKEYAQDNA